jgi:hypothetical protein
MTPEQEEKLTEVIACVCAGIIIGIIILAICLC